MNPKVSIIIPVYNASSYLEQCLECLVNQTLKDIEIICIDDGSTDGSLDILKYYAGIDNRIKVYTQQNLFAGTARNLGMSHAKGEYFVFLDADDFFELDLVEKEYLKCKYYDADICLCGADKFDTLKKSFIPTPQWLNLKDVKSEAFNRYSLKEHLFDVTSACPWTKMFSAKFIRENKLEFQNLQRANDVYFTLCSLALAQRIVYTNNVLVHYRVNNKSSLQNNNRNTPGLFLRALDAVYDRLDLEKQDSGLKQAFANVALGHISYNLKCLEESDAIDEFLYVFNNVKQHYIEKFGLLNKQKDYFFNKNDLEYLIYKGLLVINNAAISEDEKDIEDESKPIVTFIVPIHNTGAYVEECLQSILNQTIREIEVICIDDASTDDSALLVRNMAKNDSRIRLYQHKICRGPGGSRNTGLDHADGKYIWFVDSDDYIDESAVAHLLEVLRKHDDKIDLLGFNASAFTLLEGVQTECEGGIRRNWPNNQLISCEDDSIKNVSGIEGSSVTYIAKKDFVNLYRFRENVTFEDADYSFKIYTTKKKKFFMIDYTPYHRRIRTESITGNGARGFNEKSIKGRILASRVIYDYVHDNNINFEFAIRWLNCWAKWCMSLYLERPDIYDMEINDIVIFLQQRLFLFSFEECLQYRDVLLPKVIVSLTTINSRINTVDQVIKSLLNQSVYADQILLYISTNDYSDETVPVQLSNLEKINPSFKIIPCEDLKPHKKYFYAMRDYEKSIIITVDDDVRYTSDLIKTLLLSYVRYPFAVSCMRGHTIKVYDEQTIAPYKKWQLENKIQDKPSLLVLPTGVGGVLYPPYSISRLAFDKKKINQLALYTDDLWLKWMQLKLNTPCVLIKNKIKLDYIENTQEEALWLTNVNKNKNDVAMKTIIELDNGINYLSENILEKLYYASHKFAVRDNLYAEELANIKNGYSFRIGRKITWLPRMIRGGLKCFSDHGVSYTIKRAIEHCGINMGTGDFRKRKK